MSFPNAYFPLCLICLMNIMEAYDYKFFHLFIILIHLILFSAIVNSKI